MELDYDDVSGEWWAYAHMNIVCLWFGCII